MKVHQVNVERKRFYYILRRFRASCKYATCPYKGPWRKSERAAIADGWYHDDVTLFKMLTEPSVDKPAKP